MFNGTSLADENSVVVWSPDRCLVDPDLQANLTTFSFGKTHFDVWMIVIK
jgi:hypothetical protein